MPNGLNLLKDSDAWRKLEAPLLQIDSCLESFAKLHGMHITRNHHNWPSRILGWSSRGLKRGIGIVLNGPKNETYNVGAYASKGSGMTWLSNKALLREAVRSTDISANIGSLLAEACETAERWEEQDLTDARRIDVGAIFRRLS